jgi:CheY-like chemotaxis protein
MPAGGAVVIAAERLTTPIEEYEGAFVRLSVSDTGTGMPPEVAARAIEPFFTTKEVGKGTGLGLSMVYGFVRQSGGQMSIDSKPSQGTAIRICLPSVLAARLDQPIEERAPIAAAPRPTTILVVDDDRAVRGFLVAVARGLGHRVIEAADGAEALAALSIAPEIELLFSDVAMPNGMTGYELAAAARRQRPALKILLTSGFPARDVLQRAALDPDIRVLQKPYDPSELAANIAQTLEDRP